MKKFPEDQLGERLILYINEDRTKDDPQGLAEVILYMNETINPEDDILEAVVWQLIL